MYITANLSFDLEAILKSAGDGTNVKNVVSLTYTAPTSYTIAGYINCAVD